MYGRSSHIQGNNDVTQHRTVTELITVNEVCKVMLKSCQAAKAMMVTKMEKLTNKNCPLREFMKRRCMNAWPDTAFENHQVGRKHSSLCLYNLE